MRLILLKGINESVLKFISLEQEKYGIYTSDHPTQVLTKRVIQNGKENEKDYENRK